MKRVKACVYVHLCFSYSALYHQEQKQCQAEAWQHIQTKINRIDRTVIPSTGKLFSSLDLDTAKADLEQLQHVQELADFFRDFVGLRKQIGGLIISFAILERHPMFCRGECQSTTMVLVSLV